MNIDDINLLLKNSDMEIVVKKVIPENSEDAFLRRFKDRFILIVGIGVISIVFLLCIFLIIQNSSNTTAINSAFGIATGFAGYILRGKS